LLLVFWIFLISLNFATASSTCNLNISLVNQDPEYAVPGDYVKVVFQMSGIENSKCNGAIFKVVPKYPFSLDENKSAIKKLEGGTYVFGYKKTWNLPYTLRVDENAIDGNNEIEINYAPKNFNENFFSKIFNISVKDSRVDFEISVKDYDSENNQITFEILNIGDSDVEALTVNIPEQKNFILKGSSRNIIGSLDSNEDTTFTFKANPKKGNINMNILYTDINNIRRNLNKTIFFNPKYFESEKKGFSVSFYILIIFIIAIALFYIQKKLKNKRKH